MKNNNIKMEIEEYIDNTKETSKEEDQQLLETVLKEIKWEFIRDILVKPLPEKFIEKVISNPIDTGKRDEAGIPIYDSKDEIKTLPANFKEGIVLSIPSSYEWPKGLNVPKVGDTIVYHRKGIITFDLFKDSELVNPYNMVAVIRSI